MTDTFQARFWGARGTLASMSDDTRKYGGNTACIEVVCGDNRLIFDAGSGIRQLGEKIVGEFAEGDKKGLARKPINLLFTHCHYDHISGFPFFAPFFDPECKIDIWSGHLSGPDKTEWMIRNYMTPPFFPVGPEVFSASLNYHDFDHGNTLTPLPNVMVETLALNHHDGCIGYRIYFEGRSICIMTDTTHIEGEHDPRVLKFIKGADLMIYDATYTDEEFPQFWNFGHSTWEEGVRLSKHAGVARYCIFHHRPSRNDEALDEIGAQCKKQFSNSWVAAEGLVIEV